MRCLLFKEVPTCEQSGEWCAQLCHDDAEGGGYKCACHEGYLLSDDKHTCTAISGKLMLSSV